MLGLRTNRDGYRLFLEKKGIKMYKKEDPDHPSIPFLRLETTLAGVTPDWIMALFKGETMFRQKEWNKRTKFVKKVPVTSGEEVFHTAYSIPIVSD